jgi:hypothetical protein
MNAINECLRCGRTTLDIGSDTHNCGYTEIVREHSSATVINLRRHSSKVSLTHSGVYTCEICDEAFTSNDELMKNVNKKHEEKMIIA